MTLDPDQDDAVVDAGDLLRTLLALVLSLLLVVPRADALEHSFVAEVVQQRLVQMPPCVAIARGCSPSHEWR